MNCVVCDCAISEEALTALLKDSDGIARSPNFWLPMARIAAHQASTAAEQVICNLYHNIVSKLPGKVQYMGAEWWVQVYQPGKGLAFHFDKDETAFKEQQVMHHPLWSSVLYITGSSNHPTSPTVIIDQRYDNATRNVSPEDPGCSVLVWPLKGRYLLFGGDLGHGVLESTSQQKRITMLVNWWTDRQPQCLSSQKALQWLKIDNQTDRAKAVHPVAAAQLQQYGMSQLTDNHESASQPALSSQNGVAIESGMGQQAATRGSANNAETSTTTTPTAGECSADARTAGSKDPAAGSSNTNSPGELNGAEDTAELLGHLKIDSGSIGWVALAQQEIQHVTCPAGDVSTVDELLESNGWLQGDTVQIAALRITHPGCALFPLEVADNPHCITAGAVVPLAMLAGSDSDSE